MPDQDPKQSADPKQAAQQEPATQEETFFGKYKSKEDAERGYKELERFAYDQSRQLADVKKQVEEWAAQQQYQQPQYAPAGTMQGYQGYPSAPQAEVELQKFYTNPVDYLHQREKQLEDRAYQRAIKDVRTELTNRDIVSQWKSDNSDLVRHEALVATFVAQQPGHLSVREKLDRAADESRKYLAEIARQGQRGQGPQPHQVVEHPARVSSQGPVVHQNQEPPDQESVLADYVSERNALKAKKMMTR